MNNFVITNNQFIYEDTKEKRILLDCTKFLQNKSRLPFHSFQEETLTVPKLLLELLKKHEEICGDTEHIYNNIY